MKHGKVTSMDRELGRLEVKLILFHDHNAYPDNSSGDIKSDDSDPVKRARGHCQ